ncbi:Peptidylprolyl isomerase [Melia azedarach]|uniref:Peptidylprolyl isomerase n=1 Tax=Melia azedarach TaxID=155640 RepID=A0ACC1WUB9_MELAZ|nr:Peptidylprolyl isomerase [Melia azedarach]
MMIRCFAPGLSLHAPHHPTIHSLATKITANSPSSSSILATRREALSLPIVTTTVEILTSSFCSSCSAAETKLLELPNSGGVKALDLRVGTGPVPVDGDQVAIHYYGRLPAKQGWRFDSTYDHKDETGEPIPFVFVLGSGKVIPGIEAAVRSMKVGGVRRAVIPPSQGYQSTSQEPIPPNFFDRQRLFTTIFNPTRLANGEGSTLGTLIFDIELVSLRH